MNNYFDCLQKSREYSRLTKLLESKKLNISVEGPSESQKAHFSLAILKHTDKKGIYIAQDELAARRIYDDLKEMDDDIVYLPARETIYHNIDAVNVNPEMDRINSIIRIINNEYRVVVMPVNCLSSKMMPTEKYLDLVIDIELGEEIERNELTRCLVDSGYKRVDSVSHKGEYAVRGGIVDIFPSGSDLGLRVEFYGDEIDSLRTFVIETQRSVENIQKVKILPSKEILISKEEIKLAKESILVNLDSEVLMLKKLKKEEAADNLKTTVETDLELFQSINSSVPVDRYIDQFDSVKHNILEYFTGEEILFFDENHKCRINYDNRLAQQIESTIRLVEKGKILKGCMDNDFEWEDLYKFVNDYSKIYLNTLHFSDSIIKYDETLDLSCKVVLNHNANLELISKDMKEWKQRGYDIFVMAGSTANAKRIVKGLNVLDITAIEGVNNNVNTNIVKVCSDSLHTGFEYAKAKVAFISLKTARGKRKIKSNKKKIDSFTDISTGDIVVHDVHGIGRYLGITSLVIEKIKKDYLEIAYKGESKLFIPVNQMDAIQKYIGSEGKAPRLSKMGGDEWETIKSRVKREVAEIAAELVELYAKRETIRGFNYSIDTVWQNQFEESFPYEETQDQLSSVLDIKKDMESSNIMDRLLCGDVGYGKTEVALRAMFKAVMDGKQVAYLVPTTVLAQQQYINIVKRLDSFPVEVDMVCRFRTRSQQKIILENVRKGAVDILIGTHRILQKDVKFKNLGLLVIDEEQRFGVEHKEKIKTDFPGVDVLTLTATPIPRTLHMSLSGIRDISIIEDPPEDRWPVETFVMEYDEEIVRSGIAREVARDGQVFYLYNRVKSIERKASEISKMLPGVRVAVAHGQMEEKRLEQIMQEFIEGEYDVLVCTTIIESGLDMPNVNTIIIEDAQKMGLAQLYQLRGRVGRSNRKAYSYITYKKGKVLTEIAEKRLNAIREFTELGSGFKIAMRDMEIRGTGNLLGKQQHGHLEAVGYEMYVRMLDRAIKQIRGNKKIQTEEINVTIDINVNAYLDKELIPSEIHRIEIYKKISMIETKKEGIEVQDEIIDRFGNLPEPSMNLISISIIKKLAFECNIVTIKEKDDTILFNFSKHSNVLTDKLRVFISKQIPGDILFSSRGNLEMILKGTYKDDNDKLLKINNLLTHIKFFEN